MDGEFRTVKLNAAVSAKGFTVVLSVAIVTAAGVTPGAAVFAEEVERSDSVQLYKPLKDAYDDLKAQKYADAISKLTAADAIEGKTAYDHHVINDMLGFAYVHTNDYADAAKAWEAEIDDGFLTQADQPQKVRALAELNYQLKNYDKTIEYGRRAINGGYGDETMQNAVGQAYYLKGDWNRTREFEDELVTEDIKQGKTPRKILLQLLYSACFKLQDRECAARGLGLLNRYYPGTWRPDLRAPPIPPVGTIMAFFFAPPVSPESRKPSTTK
jgi:tetratricopeptide (TPR) repeat protein